MMKFSILAILFLPIVLASSYAQMNDIRTAADGRLFSNGIILSADSSVSDSSQQASIQIESISHSPENVDDRKNTQGSEYVLGGILVFSLLLTLFIIFKN
jgi:hypothetical protein